MTKNAIQLPEYVIALLPYCSQDSEGRATGVLSADVTASTAEDLVDRIRQFGNGHSVVFDFAGITELDTKFAALFVDHLWKAIPYGTSLNVDLRHCTPIDDLTLRAALRHVARYVTRAKRSTTWRYEGRRLSFRVGVR